MSDFANRYDRQIILPEVRDEGQAKLASAKVVVVGAGGLGVPVLQYLVGAGVGAITIIDPDEVSLNNLHRQVLYAEEHIGRSKSDCAGQILKSHNSDIKITPIPVALNPANVDELCDGADIVVDCADSFAVSYILSDFCLENAMPLISASALALSGYVGGFCGSAPSLRALFPELPDRAGNCATAGVLGPVVGTIGALQAQMVLTVLLGLKPSPLGQMVNFDARTFRFSCFRFDDAPEPKKQVLNFIAPEQIELEDFVVELRGEDEVSKPIVAHALRSEVDNYIKNLQQPVGQKRAVFVCRTGVRAHKAATQLYKNWNGDIVLVATG